MTQNNKSEWIVDCRDEKPKVKPEIEHVLRMYRNIEDRGGRGITETEILSVHKPDGVNELVYRNNEIKRCKVYLFHKGLIETYTVNNKQKIRTTEKDIKSKIGELL